MFCSKCGKQVDTSQRFCPDCGNDLSALTGAGKTTPISAQPAPQENETDLIREALKDEYELEKELGRGGMAVVFKAKDKQLEREVAIKVLPFSLSFDAEFVERFQREARTAGRLEHPNIIPIYRVGRSGRVIYFVMKFIRGKSLSQVIETRGAIPVPEIKRLLKEATSALGYAHKHGIVHRDIKPDNIMFDEQGQAIVTDFGIAKAQSGAKLTGTGMSIGTPHYMSPEQARAQNLDGRSDIYSLGVVGYQALTGHVPFDGEDSFSIGYKHIMEELPVPSLDSPDQRELFQVVQRMMAKKPDDRFQNCEELLGQLDGGVPAAQDMSTMKTVAIEPLKRAAPPPNKMAAAPTTPLPRASDSMMKKPKAAAEEPPTKASPARQTERPSFRPKETTKKSNMVPIGIAAALVVVVGGLGGYLYMQKQQQHQAQQVAVTPPPAAPVTPPAPDSSASAQHDTAKAAAPAPAPATAPPPAAPPAAVRPAAHPAPPPASARTTRPTAPPPAAPPAAATAAGEGTISLQGAYPNGARILLNGQPRTGSRFKVPAGQYTLEIQAQGYQPYTNRITVQPGVTNSVPVALVPATGAAARPGAPPAAPVAAGAPNAACATNPTMSVANSNHQCYDTRPVANTLTVLPPPAACSGNVRPSQLLVHVSAAGEVVGSPTVQQRSNCRAFDDAATAQMQDITFTPARKGGTAVESWVIIRMAPQH